MLSAAIADLVLLALVAGLSPFPLVAAVVAAGSDEPATAPAFAAGWVAGLGTLAAVFFLVAGEIDPGRAGPDAWVQILAGAALLLAAGLKWRGRPRRGAPAEPPRWMSPLDGAPASAFGIGAALGGANPKNLALAAAAAATAHYHGLLGLRAALGALVFVGVGSSTVVGIVLAASLGGARTAGLLAALKRFMLRYSNVITMAICGLAGIKLLYEGLSILLR